MNLAETKPFDQAFPSEDGAPGLTKREYFASQALQGLLSNPKMFPNDGIDIVFDAIEYADQLIKSLNDV